MGADHHIMQVILILGAGRSSSSVITYLLQEADKYDWKILVADFSAETARARIGNHARGEGLAFDIYNPALSHPVLSRADVVISLLPPHLHVLVATVCITLQKHLLTASYVSPEMRALDEKARSRDLLFLNECGLDPGIDHMSAMQVIDRIKSQRGVLVSFESFTGGLIAPETDPDNLWRYKFTWNPRNVVTAGQSTAKFLQNGHLKYIPYQQLFLRTSIIDVEGLGKYEGYANRDSLKYIETYGLYGVQTMLRGTLRQRGFCNAWNIFVQLGCCDDSYSMDDVGVMTHRDFINAFLPDDIQVSVEEKLMRRFSLNQHSPEMEKLMWSGFFDHDLIGLDKGTPAQILEHILNKKWKLHASDKDMIVMHHRFVYKLDGTMHQIEASLGVKGDDAIHTAMAKTVGLPLGIVARLLLQGKIQQRGVEIPVHPEIYNPVLKELKALGIALQEKEITL